MVHVRVIALLVPTRQDTFINMRLRMLLARVIVNVVRYKVRYSILIPVIANTLTEVPMGRLNSALAQWLSLTARCKAVGLFSDTIYLFTTL
jgi:hypothetical protein